MHQCEGIYIRSRTKFILHFSELHTIYYEFWKFDTISGITKPISENGKKKSGPALCSGAGTVAACPASWASARLAGPGKRGGPVRVSGARAPSARRRGERGRGAAVARLDDGKERRTFDGDLQNGNASAWVDRRARSWGRRLTVKRWQRRRRKMTNGGGVPAKTSCKVRRQVVREEHGGG